MVRRVVIASALAALPAAASDLRWLDAPPTARVGQAWIAALEFGPRVINPFDPDEVSIEAEFAAAHRDAVRLPAAWIEPYRVRPAAPPRYHREWMEPHGKPHWRITWRPSQPGTHTLAAIARFRGLTITSAPMVVAVATGADVARVCVSRRDPRFFALHDGRPFFAIGQNLCFIGPMQRVSAGRIGEVIARLAEHRLNYLRIWTGCDDWAISLEPGRGGGGPSPERWPVHESGVTNRGMGAVNQPDAAMLDLVVDAAESAGVYLQICLLTRDRYMGRLRDPAAADYDAAIRDACRLFRYAIARWGASPAVAVWEYWNELDPGLPAGRFYRELAGYLDRTDPWRRPRTASTWAPSPALWQDPALDVADLHWYLRPNWSGPWTDAAAAVLDRAALLRRNAPDRPALLSEFGLADEQWRLSPLMRADQNLRHVHDALWASALSGLAGTAMFWWWETLEAMGAERCYPPLARFLDGFDWTGGVEPLRVTAPDRLLCVGLCVGDDLRLWIRDRDASWHREVVGGQPPAEIDGAQIELNVAAPGTWAVEWWNTIKGEPRGRDLLTAGGRSLRLRVPRFNRDIALRARRTAAPALGGSTAPR
ncbi:MAG: hypothetical protein N2652_01875 [Kiritimatiellae bacterium]|nr:hypothetical protein [Kiritimatiellia bacterium]